MTPGTLCPAVCVGCVVWKVERAAPPSQDGGVSGGGGSGGAFGDVHELLKVAPPALAQLLSFDHLRYGNASWGVSAHVGSRHVVGTVFGMVGYCTVACDVIR